MISIPPETLYQRWMGWHAPALRRAVVVAAIWVAVALVLTPFMPWEMTVVAGWDAAALTFLISVWPIMLRADGRNAEQLATREDEVRGLQATVLLVGASVISLLGVGFALSFAGRQTGAWRVLPIGLAVLTVTLSWTLVNTVYTLRYAELHFRSSTVGIAFGDSAGRERPTYRDFAYVAFTIGMTYQVSDTTVRDPRIRRAVLSHAILSYLWQQFGFLCDLITIGTDGTARHYEELPVDYVLANSTRDYFTVTLEYGPDHDRVDPFDISAGRIAQSDAEHAAKGRYLHPVVRAYRLGGLVAEHHVTENLENRWTDEAVHRAPLRAFLARELGRVPV